MPGSPAGPHTHCPSRSKSPARLSFPAHAVPDYLKDTFHMPTRTELTSDELNFLRSVFPGELLLSPEELLVYRSDASLIQGTPLACVCPENTDQVQKLMAWADEVRMPIYIRGRGTNLVGDCVAVQPGIIVSTSKMDHILKINNRDFVGIVEPGVNTARFQAACEAKGVYYPPDPATVKASSLGGNVVTCAGGMRAVKYGVTRDFVLGTEVILPGGEKVMFGGRAHKNVVGLDLAKLMVGSEGTLGFISKIFLKLLPKPESSATVMAGFASYKDALEAVGGIFGAGILPCALEFIGERIVKLMNKDGDIPWPADKVNSVLLIRLDGSRETLPIEINQVAHNLPSAVWTLKGVGPEQEEPLWEIRRRINPTVFQLAPDKMSDDAVVPRGRLVEAVQEFERIGREHNVILVDYGHVGDGNVHVNVLYDSHNPEETQRARDAIKEVSKVAIALGGSESGEHGIGIVKDVSLQLDAKTRELMRGIKAVFDPHGIMNPGKGY